jgi:hypothetical protein
MLSHIGAEAGDLPDAELLVWPDNAPAVGVFVAMQTQWQVNGEGEPMGMRYESLAPVFQAMGIKKGARRRAFQDLRVMEVEALVALSESRGSDQERTLAAWPTN